MKTFTRWLLVLLLVAAPMMMVVDSPSANTELVPAARLVVPYWDISGSRSTLILLTNVSKTIHLVTPNDGVHIEFYDKTCLRTDTTIDLTAGDIDQLDLKVLPNLVGNPNLPSQLGWVDIDVRDGDAQINRDGLQYNVLVGTVVISDSASDFALAYPAAASIGTSFSSVGGTIVTRDNDGKAVTWTGRYEPFPSRVFVPAFFAEGGPLNTASLLVLAGPADGNWDGLDSAGAEAPGQFLGGSTTILVSGTSLFFDGCENKNSQAFSGHYINSSLTALFGAAMANQTNWKNPGASCKSPASFPSRDSDFSGAFVGWIDIPNTVDSGLGKDRGLVGVLVQSALVGTTVEQGDVGRLWGDPAAGGRDGNYSLVDEVSHADLN